MDSREFERQVFKYLKKKFDSVQWLSRNSNSPIDFKCFKGDHVYYVEAKYRVKGEKIRLLPTQRDVDAVVTNNNDKLRIIWRKDFEGRVVVSKMQLIKISAHLKELLTGMMHLVLFHSIHLKE